MNTKKHYNRSIVSDPKIQMGQFTIEGTRINAAVIDAYYRGAVGLRRVDKLIMIASLYNLSIEQVADCVRFCNKRRKQHKSKWWPTNYQID